MNKTLLPTLLVATAAGGVAAFVVTAVFASPGSSERDSAASPAVGTSAAAGGDGAASVAELRRENDELLLRVASLESTVRRLSDAAANTDSRSAMTTGLADEVTPESVSKREFLDAFASDGRVPDLFVSRVGEALDEIRAAEDAARVEAEVAAQAERVEVRLVRLRDDLGLSAYQVDEMRGILLAEEATRSELWSNVREGTDRGSMRDKMREARDEQTARLSEVLDPDQLERYQESRGRGFGGLGLGGGGVRGDDGGGRRGVERPDRTRG